MADRGPWMQTFTGRQFFPLDPRPEDFEIEDVAHALSHLCRYGGHCLRFYSVAEHSVHVADKCVSGRTMRRGALLHDAAEAYLVDVPRPVKACLPEYKRLEHSVEMAIAERFDLFWPIKQPLIEDLDNRILVDEQKQVMAGAPAPWGTSGPPLDVTIEGWPPEIAKVEFLSRFMELAP